MKRYIQALVAAAFISAPSCTFTSSVKPTPQREWQDNLEEILSGVVCIRATSINGQETSRWYGSGFVLGHEYNGYTYITTSAHVVQGFGKTTTFTLVDNAFDTNASNDLSLEVVRYDPSVKDTAILRVKAQLPVPTSYQLKNASDLRVGDEVYVLGYPRGTTKAVVKGIVAGRGEQNQIFIDANVNPGNSGGIVLYADENKQLYLIGQLKACLAEAQNECAGIGVARPIDELIESWRGQP